MPGSQQGYFSASFTEARSRFLAAAERVGATRFSHPHPAPGLHGEALGTDLALVGDPAARAIAVIESGTHGVEGYTGSAIQLATLEQGLAGTIPRGLAVLFIHAINPYGFSWCRRGDQDNVDVNRNFVDFTKEGALRNDLFRELAPHLVPASWTDEALASADAQLDRLRRLYGPDVVGRSLRCGQHSHPGSVFFGGLAPSWSRCVVERIAAERLAHADTIVFLDVHTGLGDYGGLQLLSTDAPGSDEFALLSDVFGSRVRSTVDPASGAANATGNIFAGYRRCLPRARFLGLGMEFGTYDQQRVQRALRADAWANLHQDAAAPGPSYEQVRNETLEAFCPRDSRWRNLVMQQGLDTFRIALGWLKSTSRGIPCQEVTPSP